MSDIMSEDDISVTVERTEVENLNAEHNSVEEIGGNQQEILDLRTVIEERKRRKRKEKNQRRRVNKRKRQEESRERVQRLERLLQEEKKKNSLKSVPQQRVQQIQFNFFNGPNSFYNSYK